MNAIPIDRALVERETSKNGIKNVGRASIREILALVNGIESQTGIKFIRMEMGIPGLPACRVGIEAEKAALERGCASIYPSIEGIPELKRQISRFVKLFLDIDVDPVCCVPSTGSAAGSFITFLVAARMDPAKDTTLFLDPGFPVHKQQLRVLGLGHQSVDVYEHRGDKLRDKLEQIMSSGKISTILYSNPNNPTWICFTEHELGIIGELATKYHAVVIEDLAYLTMDFRHDYSRPGEPPFQPTVARYTDRYVLLISSSKVFSYAGQRIGMMVVSNALFREEAPGLERFFTRPAFGHCLTYGAAYAVSAGVTHSCQHGLVAMLNAANDGTYRFTDEVKAYGRRAKAMKSIFLEAGFRIVYDTDVDQPIADGFYFTVAYPGLDGEQLLRELLHYGISAIALVTTGSLRHEGIRACVSLVADSDLPELAERLGRFDADRRAAPAAPAS